MRGYYHEQKYPPERHNGAESIIVAIITCVLVSVMGLSLSRLQNTAFLNLSSGSSSLQAQQYAAMESERLRITAYADLTSKSKTKILNSSYYSEVIVGTESDYNDMIKQKECTVNVYKDGDVLPCCTVKVVRMTKENTGNTGVPQGTIIPWYGNLNNIPDGFALCNGQNGTPDLRDRFLVGAGSSYTLGSIGGEAFHVLTVDELANHTHYQATNNGVEQEKGREVGYNLHAYFPDIPAQGYDYGDSVGPVLVSGAGNSQPHENRPPYFAVYY